MVSTALSKVSKCCKTNQVQVKELHSKTDSGKTTQVCAKVKFPIIFVTFKKNALDHVLHLRRE